MKFKLFIAIGTILVHVIGFLIGIIWGLYLPPEATYAFYIIQGNFFDVAVEFLSANINPDIEIYASCYIIGYSIGLYFFFKSEGIRLNQKMTKIEIIHKVTEIVNK